MYGSRVPKFLLATPSWSQVQNCAVNLQRLCDQLGDPQMMRWKRIKSGSLCSSQKLKYTVSSWGNNTLHGI